MITFLLTYLAIICIPIAPATKQTSTGNQ